MAQEQRSRPEPPDGRILHGSAPFMCLYDKEAVPYIEATGHDFVLFSDYMDLLVVDGLTPQLEQAYCKLVDEKGPQLGVDGDAPESRYAKAIELVNAFNTTPRRVAEFRKRTGKPYTPLLGIMWQLSTDEAIASGGHDREIRWLAEQVKACDFPVFLRPGFEFGPYGYMEQMTGMVSREHYVPMFRRFVDIFRDQRVENVIWVWSAVGVESYDYWMDYYPGDDYVDWFGINFFAKHQIAGAGPFLAEAKRRGKPVVICESAPAFEGGVADPDVWQHFFEPYFSLISASPNIKAMVYVNLDWSALPGGPFRHWPDSRVQIVPDVLAAYRQAISDPRFIHLSDYQQP